LRKETTKLLRQPEIIDENTFGTRRTFEKSKKRLQKGIQKSHEIYHIMRKQLI